MSDKQEPRTLQTPRQVDTSLTLPVEKIRTDGGTQPREAISRDVVNDYADALREGETLPPVDVFQEGKTWWLADGFHRHAAHVAAKLKNIRAVVHQGTRRDAILFAAGANASHGLRRTNADKRRAVELLLKDQEWSQWSDREIARQCGVSDRFVSSVRGSLSANDSQMRTVSRGGTSYTINTSNIGGTSPAKPPGNGNGHHAPPPPPAKAAPDPRAPSESNGKPWDDYNAGVDKFVGALKAAASVARDVFQAEGQELKREYAKRLSWSATVGAVNAIIRNVERDGRIVDIDKGGIVTAGEQRTRSAMQKGRGK